MDEIKKIKIRDKLEEEIIKEEEIVRVPQYKVYTDNIVETLCYLCKMSSKQLDLIDKREKITNMEVHEINEKQMTVLNALMKLNDFIRIMVSKKKHS